MVDPTDLKSVAPNGACRFKSDLSYKQMNIKSFGMVGYELSWTWKIKSHSKNVLIFIFFFEYNK